VTGRHSRGGTAPGACPLASAGSVHVHTHPTILRGVGGEPVVFSAGSSHCHYVRESRGLERRADRCATRTGPRGSSSSGRPPRAPSPQPRDLRQRVLGRDTQHRPACGAASLEDPCPFLQLRHPPADPVPEAGGGGRSHIPWFGVAPLHNNCAEVLRAFSACRRPCPRCASSASQTGLAWPHSVSGPHRAPGRRSARRGHGEVGA
jgi:hypothetical protein